jgi:translation initiation factor IF-2
VGFRFFHSSLLLQKKGKALSAGNGGKGKGKTGAKGGKGGNGNKSPFSLPPAGQRKLSLFENDELSVSEVSNASNVHESVILNAFRRELDSDLTVESMLSPEDIALIMEERFGYEVTWLKQKAAKHKQSMRMLYDQYVAADGKMEVSDDAKAEFESCVTRPPIVSIMGHVDHGKTTLLDALRSTNTADKEAGGITQSVGAFSVSTNDLQAHGSGTANDGDAASFITFIDTPGHQAFSSMRERGAMVTDIAVVVVAGDDGVMEQTKEVLKLCRDSIVPMIVAVTKMDKLHPDEQATALQGIHSGLLESGIASEDMGGDVPVVSVSGKTGAGISDFLEMIELQAGIMELNAPTHARGEGMVLESFVDKREGILVDVLVTWGTLHVGDIIVCGEGWGTVRSLKGSRAADVEKAVPSQAVRISGFRNMVYPGDIILTADSVGEAKVLCNLRKLEREKKEDVVLTEAFAVTDEDALEFNNRRGARRIANRPKTVIKYRSKAVFKQQMLEDGTISLNEGPRNVPIIVKSNTVGVLQVIKDTIAQFDHKDLDLSVVSAKTGHINGGDVDFAETVKAPIFGFSVDIPQAVAKYAIERNVKIYKQRIIYMMIDDIRDHMSSCLDPVETEVLLGKADILQTFELNNNRRGVPNPVVAGCKVFHFLHAQIFKSVYKVDNP